VHSSHSCEVTRFPIEEGNILIFAQKWNIPAACLRVLHTALSVAAPQLLSVASGAYALNLISLFHAHNLILLFSLIKEKPLIFHAYFAAAASRQEADIAIGENNRASTVKNWLLVQLLSEAPLHEVLHPIFSLLLTRFL
jgi:hypothetical protein